MLANIVFLIFLFVSIWIGTAIVCRLFSRDDIHWLWFFIFSISLTGVIAHIVGIY